MRKLGALLATMLGTVTVGSAQQPPKPQPRAIFSGTVNLQRPQVSKVGVAVHIWTIREGQKHAALEIPGKGLLVVQVRTGTITTVIGGKREERKEGDFWTVPAGVAMGVETGQDTAILQTVLISE